jgi:hypothetical protein
MSTHGRGTSRLLIGSVADKVLRSTSAALLLRRPTETLRNRAAPRVSHLSKAS